MRGHRTVSEVEVYRLPAPPVPGITAAGFACCPAASLHGLTLVQWCCVQAVYQLAFEQAQAVARPSLLERDLAGVWN